MSGDTRGGQPGPKESPKRPRQLKQARVGWPPALRELKDLVYKVYLAAGTPSLDEITANIADDDGLVGAPSRDTVHRVISDGEQVGQQADVVAVATVLAVRAAWDAPDLAARVRELWVRARMAQGAGRPLSELRGDVRLVLDDGLGVHPALDTDGARDRFGILPAYIPRDHDARLKTVVDAAVAGRSGIAVLVGGSSTGKTRALWEAVDALPEGWRLWHPLTPTAPQAALAALPDIAPRTVVWLNEAQHYLSPDPLGEQVAAGLRELLTDPLRAPVLVLGTLWPGHWDTLTSRTASDRHASARALLGGHKIDVPKAFTAADLAALVAVGDADPRLAQAIERAEEGQVTQYLAGVPYLMDRFHAAEGATLALIHAAMDARRLGAGPYIPLGWLDDAAPAYLTETEYQTLGTDWLGKALAYVTEPCNGIPGILTPVNTRRPRNQRSREWPDHSPQGPHYLLADYLDQHGRNHRAEFIPPIDFWSAAADHAHPEDLTELGEAAWARGLYRDAVQLHKHATTHGNPQAAVTLVHYFQTLHPTDHHPAQYAATHVALDNPRAVATLLGVLRGAGANKQAAALAERAVVDTILDDPGTVVGLLGGLRKVGAHEQVTALLTRDPAAHIILDDPGAVTRLLEELEGAGAHEQATALAKRAAAYHTTLDDPYAVAVLLKALRGAGAHEQATALTMRAAEHHATLGDPYAAANLRKGLREAGAHEQASALAERAAAHAALGDLYAVAYLLEGLRKAGAHKQVTTLAKRAAAHVALDDPDAVAHLVVMLRKAGAHEQVTALAERAVAHAALDNPPAVAVLLVVLVVLAKVGADEQLSALVERVEAHAVLGDPATVAHLLEVLGEAGADEHVALLAERAVARITFDDPYAVAYLLRVLGEAGADEQTTTLLARDPAAHIILDDPYAVGHLLRVLRRVGAHEQATALVERAAAHITLDNPAAVARLVANLRETGAGEHVALLVERAAAHITLDNPTAVAYLLQVLGEAGADDQVTALAERAAAHAALDDPRAAGRLLVMLRRVGAHEQATALAKRAATLDAPRAVAHLLEVLGEAGADEHVALLVERAFAHITLDDPYAVAYLLRVLGEAGADDQVTALAERAAAHAALDDPRAVGHLLRVLRQAGADEQVAALAERAATHAVLDNLGAVLRLLEGLQEAGAHTQAATLTERLPGAGCFEVFISLGGNRTQFRFGREPDGSAAPAWTWNDMV
ncbi:hypothetical protein ABT030_47850 [Streptomyces mirabilis]|uniref:hypothetical protein n=1 Tax=Streptomyces mirabilis TaxID=68239 RepID=UPI00331F0851